MDKEKCIFCSFLRPRNEKIIYENDYFYCKIDTYPISPGHALIVAKRHVENMMDLNQEEGAAFIQTLQDTVRAIEELDWQKVYLDLSRVHENEIAVTFYNKMLGHQGLNKKPDGYNYGLNDGQAAGRVIHHLHWHIIPRYYGDVEDSTGGIRNLIPHRSVYRNTRPLNY